MANGYVHRQRSLAGPVLLILLGVFFFLHTAGWVSISFGELFARYWPLLLILWGVIRLVEYKQAQASGAPTPRMGAGGVILLIFFILFGLAASKSAPYIAAIKDNGGIEVDGEEFPIFFGGSTFDYEDRLEKDFPAGGSLRITNDRGEISVTSSDDTKIKVLVRKKIVARNQGTADDYDKKTKPELTVVEKLVTLNANTQGAGGRQVTTDLEVLVPKTAAVTITSRRGEVTIIGRQGDLDISSQRGDVNLDDITGNVKLSVEKSGVKISRVKGDVTLEGRVGDVSISEVTGSARLSGEYPDSVSLSRISKTVTFKTSRTDLEFAGLEGTLDLDGGDLRGSSVTGPVRVLTREKDIRLDGTRGDVRISNSNGVVEVRVNKLPVGDIDISNRNADVQVYLPDAATFRVDANTQNGEVESDFNGLQVRNEDDRGSLSGSVGAGKGMVKVSNAHGGIEVRKGSAIAMMEPPTVPDIGEPPSGAGPGHGIPTPPKPPKGKKTSGSEGTEKVQQF